MRELDARGVCALGATCVGLAVLARTPGVRRDQHVKLFGRPAPPVDPKAVRFERRRRLVPPRRSPGRDAPGGGADTIAGGARGALGEEGLGGDVRVDDRGRGVDPEATDRRA